MGRAVAVGALCGLAWACGLRGFMTQVTTGPSTVTWAARGRLLVASSFAFTAVLVVDLVQNGTTLHAGIGGGALGLPAFGVAGAYAPAGHRRWARIACGGLAVAPVPIWVLTARPSAARRSALPAPRGRG